MDELAKQVEAILFASGKGVSVEQLQEYCDSAPKKIAIALQQLQEHHDKAQTSLVVSEYQGKWKLTVRAAFTPYIQKIVSETEFAPGLLKTLAVIAYKSPVLQADIVSMRGQISYEHIKQLVKEKFITKEEEGRSYILRITNKFYSYFDVEGDQDIKDVFAQLRSQEERRNAISQSIINQEQQQKLGELEIVDSDPNKPDHEQIFQPVRKEKTEEEKKEEHNFLNDIDARIQNLAKRVTAQELPKRTSEEENTSSQDQEKTESEDEENYL